MALLTILHFPDPRLRIVAKPVAVFDASTQTLVDSLFETMYQAPGIGLAATQVNVHQRIIVVDVSAEQNQPYCLINPRLLRAEGQIRTEEGCLSVPEIYENVSRPSQISVEAQDAHGNEFTLEASELLAVCIQHEMDHLEGKLFVDKLSELKRQRIRKKFEKLSRTA